MRREARARPPPRYGYEPEAERIQDLYLAGRKGEAAAAVSDEIVDDLSIVGPRRHIAERLARFAEAGIDTLLISLADSDPSTGRRTLEQLPACA